MKKPTKIVTVRFTTEELSLVTRGLYLLGKDDDETQHDVLILVSRLIKELAR